MNSEENLYILVMAEDGKSWIKKDAGGVSRWINRQKNKVRDVGRGIREHVAPVRYISEGIFSEYGEQMEKLREVDDQILAWTKDLENALDRAYESNSSGKMLDVIFWVDQINTRLKLVSDKKKELSDLSQEYLDKYFSEYEQDLPDYFTAEPGKIVEAGFVDDIGRKVTTWKMRRTYREQVAQQKAAIKALLGSTNRTVKIVQKYLDSMSRSRASGDIGDYLKNLGKVSELQSEFEKTFKQIYNANFAHLVKRLKEQQQARVDEAAKNAPSPGLPFPKPSEVAPDSDAAPTVYRKPANPSIVPSEPSYGTDGPATVPQGPMEGLPSREPPTQRMYEGVPPNQSQPMGEEEAVPETVNESTLHSPFGLATQPPQRAGTMAPESAKAPPPVAGPPSSTQNLSAGDVILESAPKPPKRGKPAVPPPLPKEDEGPQIQRSNAHEEFVSQLKKAGSQNNPKLLGVMLLKYSEMIEDEDLDTSLKLLALAEGIIDG